MFALIAAATVALACPECPGDVWTPPVLPAEPLPVACSQTQEAVQCAADAYADLRDKLQALDAATETFACTFYWDPETCSWEEQPLAELRYVANQAARGFHAQYLQAIEACIDEHCPDTDGLIYILTVSDAHWLDRLEQIQFYLEQPPLGEMSSWTHPTGDPVVSETDTSNFRFAPKRRR